MRGKGLPGCLICRWMRIIPAHAGKSHPDKSRLLDFRDHPRSCGEKLRAQFHSLPVPGSSPLMRGKVSRIRALINTNGIIPAHAGKSLKMMVSKNQSRDHPRSCGEKHDGSLVRVDVLGSSPLMRGKVVHEPRNCYFRGIIPAHAGKRNARSYEVVGR